MKNQLHPNWIFIINTFPMVLLFILLGGQYNIIKTLLEPSNTSLWIVFGSILGGLTILNVAYGIHLLLKDKSISIWYGLIALMTYIPFLYAYLWYLEDMIPREVPRWMMEEYVFMYVGTFLMPTLAYAVYILVSHLTPVGKEHKAWKSFFSAALIPISCFLFFHIIMPLWSMTNLIDIPYQEHIIVVLFIVLTISFLFFLIRGIYIIGLKKSSAWQRNQWAWKIPIAIICPLLGLALNNGILFNDDWLPGNYIFGNFSNKWFYILAALNGIFVCMPNIENPVYRLILFIGRSVTFSYTFYFFLVFLPFLPLSLLAIGAIGAGFLMLTPLVLFLIHVNELYKDYSFLTKEYSGRWLLLIPTIGFLIIPYFITLDFRQDRSTLTEAIDYVYNPNYSKEYSLDKENLKETLDGIKFQKNDRGSEFFGNSLPFLSSYYNWLVLDNLILSNKKIEKIEQIFFDGYSSGETTESYNNQHVSITNTTTECEFDAEQNAWVSWVNLEITNDSDNRFAEFVTTLDLPEGCWISDYYLYVGDRKEMGMLVEKKAAMWVFSQIRNENKDPGLLYYLTGNRVAFRVFPFAKREVRRTGIQFIHKEPFVLDIDGEKVALGTCEGVITSAKSTTANGEVLYISSKEKQTLETTQRTPYYHFIVDASNRKKAQKNTYSYHIDEFLKEHLLSQSPKITFANTYSNSPKLFNDWQTQFDAQTFEGGFFLQRAIRKILFEHYQSNDDTYPIIVVVTDNFYGAVLEKDFADLKFTFPENNFFYHLDQNGKMLAHSLINKPKNTIQEKTTITTDSAVKIWKGKDNRTAYLPNDTLGNIVLEQSTFSLNEADVISKSWDTGLALQGKYLSQKLHPENSDKEWLNIIRKSFQSKIMTPFTSYMVVENEAQKAMLLKKQKQMLAGNKALDLGEDTQQMSEPGIWIGLLVLMFLGIRRLFNTV